MERLITDKLIKWSQNSERKPLLLQGARQVGKTYILKKIGKKIAKKVHYLNFEDKYLHSIFSDGAFNSAKILFHIEANLNKAIDRKNDLIIFDEIQDCPNAISSLKYFHENYPSLKIACAGSHIGIERGKQAFPVGKVNFLTMYPMTFREFLNESNPFLHKALGDSVKTKDIDDHLHLLLLEEYKRYLFVGGMPEAISQFFLYRDNDLFIAYEKARGVHSDLLKAYSMDFSKYSGKVNAQKIVSIFNNIPKQIQKVHDGSLRRYRFKDVLPGQSKYMQLQSSIEWLVTSGLAQKVMVISKPEIPLSAYSKENLFKLLFFDIGLLCTKLELTPNDIIMQELGNFKGFIAEVFVAQEMKALLNDELYSWQENQSEIEFLMRYRDNLIPVEVKSGNRTKAKSLSVYKNKYTPNISVKLSTRNLRIEEKHINAPIYMTEYLYDLFDNLEIN